MYLKDNTLNKRYSIFPIIHNDLWQMYKKAEAQTWVAEEPDLSKDRFEELETKEKQLEALEMQLKNDKTLIVVKAYNYWEETIHRLEIFPTKDVLISELLEINKKLKKKMIKFYI
jgi:hypothetical protein